MSMPHRQVDIPAHFKVAFAPIADPAATIQAGNARFTVLTDRLLRLEYSADGNFENRASQAFWFRYQPVPEFTAQVTENTVEIETEHLHLHYHLSGKQGFTSDNLSITVKTTGAIWRPGDEPDENLLGTTRTLDYINGYTPLNGGLMSRAGWSVVDDSATLVFNEHGWIEPRDPGGTDWYFFGYGHDYKACLGDYCRISGDMPLIPRWILGNWWSRYWAYNQQDLTQLIKDFELYSLPFSVCIIDMDWHLTETNNDSTGWTGYTWNRDLFPDPAGFITFLHEKGLRTALNLHPAEGIHDHEEQYSLMTERLGIDPRSRSPIAFNITDPEFVKAYFEELHHPNEELGVDFWWIDWQQGLSCDLPGLDPLWLINHLHFYDLGRDGIRRPFIFSRWGNEGHQRYPIGFSGDTYRTWDSLRFQTYMTPTAANVAYGWWSHDIGGHTGGFEDSELFTRWVQFGALSPINRIHVTKGDFYDNRPWMFEDAEVLRVVREALQFRHALIPYLYTMAYRAHTESLPPILPMYYDCPEHEDAYHCPHQYLFGTELIAAPFIDPADPETQLSRQVVWLPEGDWYHFFTGEHFAGDRWHAVYGRLQDIPLFARAGAIVPLGPTVGWGGVDNPDTLDIHIFAGADNTFTLYEDDGETTAYRDNHFCLTTITQQWTDDKMVIEIATPHATYDFMPDRRVFNLIIHGVSDSAQVSAEIDGHHQQIIGQYDAETETLRLPGFEMDGRATLKVTFQADQLLARRNRKRENLLRMLHFFHLHTGVRNRIAVDIDAILDDPARLAPYIITMSDSQARAIFEMLCEAGVHAVQDTHKPVTVILWNNHETDDITYRYSDAYLFFGMLRSSNHANGNLPRFLTFSPPVQAWRHGAYEEHVHPTQWHAQVDYFNLATVTTGYRKKTP